jgi:HAD superfamily hydrolase (TIGR01509 family)
VEIKAVVFDMDGVLINAREWHYEALNRALGLFGYSISRADHLTTFDGLPTSKKLELLTRERGLPADLHAFINEVKQLFTVEQIHMHCRPLFTHEYTLSKLKAAGYKVGLASNSIRSTIELMMQKANLAIYLDVVLSNQDVTHSKPHPEMYLKAAELLNVPPAQCLVVEDNEHGIKSATAAGCHVLVVSDVNEVQLDRVLDAIRRAEGAQP